MFTTSKFVVRKPQIAAVLRLDDSARCNEEYSAPRNCALSHTRGYSKNTGIMESTNSAAIE